MRPTRRNKNTTNNKHTGTGNHFCIDTSTKFEGINLEDDIEKVEVTSHESSEENEESETPKSDLEQPRFLRKNPNESIKNWLQRITDMQNEIQKKYNVSSISSQTQTHLQSIINSSSSLTTTTVNSQPGNPTRDLPYMGEMTLDNSKPRRGRKPKKADICHLIYKNYGTIFPGTPNPGSYLEKDILKKNPTLSMLKIPKTIATGLTFRIESFPVYLKEDLPKNTKGRRKPSEAKLRKRMTKTNPFNLCIRDLNHLKIRLMKNTDNTYTSEIKCEPQSDDDVEFVHETPSPMSLNGDLRFPSVTPDSVSTSSPDPMKTPDTPPTAPGGYVYWPNAGVFIHRWHCNNSC
ncbi:hypothetical protein NQ317_003541 [Molorchus minor]|uniref:Uncharacterized protein n=1 Tax=Molorchus minor TaxID=1323400 RepID=A0ABQ9K331_9CUCU|nr:hypothetical protein NQ317_003541 [Molorchus minor]